MDDINNNNNNNHLSTFIKTHTGSGHSAVNIWGLVLLMF